MDAIAERRDPEALPRGVVLLDRGFTSDVYAWGAGRVLKLFHRGTAPSKAVGEYTATRTVHASVTSGRTCAPVWQRGNRLNNGTGLLQPTLRDHQGISRRTSGK